MTTSSRACKLAVFLSLCVIVPPSSAETVFVSDRFEIGVHENTNLDSVILKMIPSGTALEVIGRNGEFVQVQTPDGTKGWVDAQYIVSDRPDTASNANYDAKLEEAVHSLGAARAEVEVLRQRVIELQRDAATALHHSNAAAEQPAPKSADDTAKKLDKAERELETLAKANQTLKSRIADLQAAQAASAEMAVEENSVVETIPKQIAWRGPIAAEARSWTGWQWLLFASILLLAFAAGGYAVDWDSRRRHGGFRV